jgi:hypothetical protein
MEIIVKNSAEHGIVLGMKDDLSEKAKRFDYIGFIDDLLKTPQDITVTSDDCMDERAMQELDKMAKKIKEKVDAFREQIELLRSGSTEEPEY